MISFYYLTFLIKTKVTIIDHKIWKLEIQSVKTAICPCSKFHFILNGWRSITLLFVEPLDSSSIEFVLHLMQLQMIQLRQILDLKLKLQYNENWCSSNKTVKQAQFLSIWTRSVLYCWTLTSKEYPMKCCVLLCLYYLHSNHLCFWHIFCAFNWPRFFCITHHHSSQQQI